MPSTEEALVAIVRSRRFWWWLRTIVFFLIAITTLRSSIIDYDLVPSGSMLPTIQIGQHVLVTKLAYDLKFPLTNWHLMKWGEPKRGDVIVFISPRDGLTLVKRVIAVGGDRISMTGNVINLNGQNLKYMVTDGFVYEFLNLKPHRMLADLDHPGAIASFAPLIVPVNSFFVMGDNRDNCIDSRVFGCVSRSAVIGRALIAGTSRFVAPDVHPGLQ